MDQQYTNLGQLGYDDGDGDPLDGEEPQQQQEDRVRFLEMHDKPTWLQRASESGIQFAASPGTRGLLLVLTTSQLLQSIALIVSKPALKDLDPSALVSAQLVLSLPFLAFVAHQERAAAQKRNDSHAEVSNKVVAMTVACAVFGLALPQLLLMTSNHLAGPAMSGAMQPAVPAFASLLAGLARVERFGWIKVLFVVLAIAGAVLLTDVPALVVHGDDTAGKVSGVTALFPAETIAALLLLLQTVCYALFLVLFSNTVKWFPFPFSAFFMSSLWASMGLVLLSMRSWAIIDQQDRSVGPLTWLAVLYCGLFSSFGAQTAQAWAVHHLGPTFSAGFLVLQAPLTVAMSAVFFWDVTSLAGFLGGTVLTLLGAAGALLTRWKEKREDGSSSEGVRTYGRLDTTGEEDSASSAMGSRHAAIELFQPLSPGDGQSPFATQKPTEHTPAVTVPGPWVDPFDTPQCLTSTLRSMRGGMDSSFLSNGSQRDTGNGTDASGVWAPDETL